MELETKDDLLKLPESINLQFSIKEHMSDLSSVTRSDFDFSKYYNIHEVYREEMAPTSISIANMHPTGEKVAIKKIFKNALINDFQRKQARQECILHCSFDHTNIVKALEWNENKEEYIIVLEYVDRPTYFKEKIERRLTPIKNEAKLKSYMNDLLEGLTYLHSRGIIHGDIKLENILLNTSKEKERDTPLVKLCDFGLSRVVDKDKKKCFMEFPVGSTSYMAPEIKAVN
jgi:serine/threonine protein kinase